MLNEKQYKELCKYRDSVVPVPQTLDDMTVYFHERKFIAPQKLEYTVHGECAVTYEKTVWLLTMRGKLAMEEFEEYQSQNRENRLWQAVSVTIGLLTLATTILFGILTLLH